MPEHQTEAENLRLGVSYVMPVLNDVVHVRQAVESILDQDGTALGGNAPEGNTPFEVLIALAPSIDGTAALVTDLAKRDQRVRVLENPIGSTPSGLNVAIKAAKYPVIVRVDAHSVLPVGYTRLAVDTLERTGADNVGGIMAAVGEKPFEKAVALAYTTPVGLGGSSFHIGGVEGPADTVYLGVFRRTSLFRVGLFDESIKRGQDWELNRRIRETGGVVWFSPSLRVSYRPRSTFKRLARQMVSTGLWRGELARRFPNANGIRYFIPPLMVIGLLIGGLAGVGGAVQFLMGTVPWLLIGLLVPLAYLVFVFMATLVYGRGAGAVPSLWFLVVLPCIHISWGTGFVIGYFSLNRKSRNT